MSPTYSRWFPTPGAELDLAVTLADIQAKGAVLTGTFPFAAALPANALLIGGEVENDQAAAGAGLVSALVKIQAVGDDDGSIVNDADLTNPAGSVAGGGANPYLTRGGQSLTAKLVTVGCTLGALAAGAFTVRVFYTIAP